jgi:TRAP-type uncharacterized transport system substrate-binding protein
MITGTKEMQLRSRILAIAVVALTATTLTQAQSLKVATGGPKGTYSTMFKELNNACASDVPLIEINSSGSNDNIALLTGNQVNGAFTQTDVLYFRARTEELGNVKTLLTLHPEEIHLLARTDSGLKAGGMLGVGGRAVVFNDINGLRGHKVGAAGGAFTTAQVIRLQTEIPFLVEQFASNADVLAALSNGRVQAALMVGGAPYGEVVALGGDFKLLPIPESVAAKLKGVYRTARLSYPKMGAAGVPTVATDALFVTREYKTPKMVRSLARFRTCAFQAIDELKETTGTHAKWQAVDVNNKGKWAWYELPAEAPASTQDGKKIASPK